MRPDISLGLFPDRFNGVSTPPISNGGQVEPMPPFAQLDVLIAYLTAPSMVRDDAISDFLMTCRYFARPEEIWSLLASRLLWAAEACTRASGKSEVGHDVGQRCFVVMRQWIRGYFAKDFAPSLEFRQLAADTITALQGCQEFVLNQFFSRILAQLRRAWDSAVAQFWPVQEIGNMDEAAPWGGAPCSSRQSWSEPIPSLLTGALPIEENFAVSSIYTPEFEHHRSIFTPRQKHTERKVELHDRVDLLARQIVNEYRDRQWLALSGDLSRQMSSDLMQHMVNPHKFCSNVSGAGAHGAAGPGAGAHGAPGAVEAFAAEPVQPRVQRKASLSFEECDNTPSVRSLHDADPTIRVATPDALAPFKSSSTRREDLRPIPHDPSADTLNMAGIGLQADDFDVLNIDDFDAAPSFRGSELSTLSTSTRSAFSYHGVVDDGPKFAPALRRRSSLAAYALERPPHSPLHSEYATPQYSPQAHFPATHLLQQDELDNLEQNNLENGLDNLEQNDLEDGLDNLEQNELENELDNLEPNKLENELEGGLEQDSLEHGFEQNELEQDLEHDELEHGNGLEYCEPDPTEAHHIEPNGELNSKPNSEPAVPNLVPSLNDNFSTPSSNLASSRLASPHLASNLTSPRDSSISLISEYDNSRLVPCAGFTATDREALRKMPDMVHTSDPVREALERLEGHEPTVKIPHSVATDFAAQALVPDVSELRIAAHDAAESLEASRASMLASPFNSSTRRVHIQDDDLANAFASAAHARPTTGDVPAPLPTLRLDLLNATHAPFVLAYSPRAVAEQMTLIEREVLAKFDCDALLRMEWENAPMELVSWLQVVTGEAVHVAGPALVEARSTLVYKWVQSEVLLCPFPGIQAQAITRFSQIAFEALRLQNFATMVQLVLALTSDEVKNCKAASFLLPHDRDCLARLENLCSQDNNFAKLRHAHRHYVWRKGCVPFTGMFLQDIEHTAKAATHNDELEVHFAKFRDCARVVRNLRRAVSSSKNYQLQLDTPLFSKCLYLTSLPELSI